MTRDPLAILLSVLDFEPLLFAVASGNSVEERLPRTQGVAWKEESKWQERGNEENDDEEREEADDRNDSSGTENVFYGGNNGVRQYGHRRAFHGKHRSNGIRKGHITHRVTPESPSCNDTWDAEDQFHPSSFFGVNKGKSCLFTADPTDLARALRQSSALTLFVVSKLSQRQVAIHGSSAVDVSTFGPNAELSRSLPCAVSSWGHFTTRIECKDPRGRMVAIIDLTVSLSCLGATGSLIQPNPTAAARSQAPTAHSTTTAPPECPAVAAAQQSSSPTQSSGSTERSDGEQAVEPAVPDALIKTSIAGSAVKDIVLTTALRPGSRESGQRRLNGSVPAGDSWTCVYDPRDGSLRDDVPTSAAAPTTCANDATIANVANACYVLSDCATSPRGSQNTPLVKVGDEGQAIAVGGAEPKAPDLGRTVVAGNLEWGVIDLTPKKSAAPRDISLGEEPVSVATAVSLAATALEQDRLPPRPAGSSENDEKVGPSRPQSDGDHTSPVEAVQDRNDGESEAPKEIREAREIIRVKAVTGNDATSRRYPGNNHFAPSWAPRALPTKQDDSIKIGFQDATITGASGTEAPSTGGTAQLETQGKRRAETRGRRTAASARQRRSEGRRRRTTRRTNASESGRPPPPSTAAATKTTDRTERQKKKKRPGTATRRPWGAGPGTVFAATAQKARMPPCDASRRATENLQGRRSDQNGGCGGGGKGDGQHERVRYFTSSSTPHPDTSLDARPPPRSEGAPLGPMDVRRFLPTWTSLVAEAAWLRGSQIHPTSDVAAGDSGCNGDVWNNIGQKSAARWSAAAPPAAGVRHKAPAATDVQSKSMSGHPRDGRTAAAGMTGTSDMKNEEGGFGCSIGGRRKGAPVGEGSVPRPSLDPTVERFLMDWLRSRIDRNGRVSLATPRGQLREETSPWAARLHGLFEETLTDLVHQRNAVPKPGGGYPESYAPDSSQTEPLSGVGWVEVVRRVSLRSERTRADAATDKEQPPQSHHGAPAPSPLDVAASGRSEPNDARPANAHQRPEVFVGGDGSQPQTHTGGGSSISPCAAGESLSSPPPSGAQPQRRVSPPPRLPPLSGRFRSPPTPPLGRAIAASSPLSRQTATSAASAAAADTTVAPGSFGGPASPRASRWPLSRSRGRHGGRAHTLPAEDNDNRDGPTCWGSATGRSGREMLGTIAATRNTESRSGSAPPSPTLDDAAAGQAEVAGEVSEDEELCLQHARDGQDEEEPPPHKQRRNRSTETIAALSDGYVGEESARHDVEERAREGLLVVEDYESDFEADED